MALRLGLPPAERLSPLHLPWASLMLAALLGGGKSLDVACLSSTPVTT